MTQILIRTSRLGITIVRTSSTALPLSNHCLPLSFFSLGAESTDSGISLQSEQIVLASKEKLLQQAFRIDQLILYSIMLFVTVLHFKFTILPPLLYFSCLLPAIHDKYVFKTSTPTDNHWSHM